MTRYNAYPGHPLRFVPQETLDAAVRTLRESVDPVQTVGGQQVLSFEEDQLEPIAHAVLSQAFPQQNFERPEWVDDPGKVPTKLLGGKGMDLRSLPERFATAKEDREKLIDRLEKDLPETQCGAVLEAQFTLDRVARWCVREPGHQKQAPQPGAAQAWHRSADGEEWLTPPSGGIAMGGRPKT